MNKFRFSILLGLAILPLVASAQGPWNDAPRVEDHFWRRRVLMRIDLKEKINRPLIRSEVRESSSMYASSDQAHGNRQGLVRALLDGFRDVKYGGYKPDSLDGALTYEEMMAKLRKLVGGQAMTQQTGATATPEGENAGNGEADPFGGGDEFGGDEFGFGEEGDGFEGAGDIDAPAASANDAATEDLLAGCNAIMEIVEDRIFDKNKSDMYYDIQYVRIIWVDPEGIYPITPAMVAFKYDDVKEILNDTQWKNWYNDAENRTMQEIFEFRLFHGFIVDVSGATSRTLDEAEKRRQQMIEFEHHLWEF
jgi:Gliding motility associated protein GldN